MGIEAGRFPSIAEMQNKYFAQNTKVSDETSDISFEQVLKGKADTKADELKFSKHASNRLYERNIELSDDQLGRLMEGTSKAKTKGINESLVIVDKLAFIVNVPNNTVITAMDQTETDENVFTNIDGAVII